MKFRSGEPAVALSTHSPPPFFLKKWLGYVDQFLVFPLQVRLRLAATDHEARVFVFADQALGPMGSHWWQIAPTSFTCMTSSRFARHVGEFKDHQTSWTGRGNPRR